MSMMMELFKFYRWIYFDQWLVVLGIPLFLLFWLILFLIAKRRKLREKISREFEPWFHSHWGIARRILYGFFLVEWPLAVLVGLGSPHLFLSVAKLLLHNAGFVVVLDGSWSMASEEDVFGMGGRFGAAKREIIEEFAPLVKERVRPRMGLVVFAGQTLKSFVLYDDYARFILQVESATIFPENVQGTNYRAALLDVLGLCEETKDLMWCGAVLITDGDREAETPGLFTEVLPKFLERNVRLDVIGVGKNDAPLPPLGEFGSPIDVEALEREGVIKKVTTKYDTKFLKEIATAGGGQFYEYGERGALRKHFQTIRTNIEKEVRERTKQWVDVSEYFYMAGLLGLFFMLILQVPFGRLKFVVRLRGLSVRSR